MKVCPNCGSEVLKDAQYCTRCGWHFETTSEPAAGSNAAPEQDHETPIDAPRESQAVSEEPITEKPAATPSRDDVSAAEPLARQKPSWAADSETTNLKTADLKQPAAVSAAGEAKASEEKNAAPSRTVARKNSTTPTEETSALDLTLDLEHTKQGFKRAWDWLIESLKHPGAYQRPTWRGTGLTMLILEALFSVITISWMVDHLSEKIAQLASGSAIVFHIKTLTTGSFLILWLLIVVATLLMSAVAYVFKRYVAGIEGGDYLDMINHLAWSSNFNVVLILISLLLTLLTSSLGMMTLTGVILLIALGMFSLALADTMLETRSAKIDRIYGALIVLVINGLIVFAAISLDGRMIKEIIVALMLQLF